MPDGREATLEAALRVIEDNHCGIPGHAVAVGCGSSGMAMLALRGHAITNCPDRGQRWHAHKNDPAHPEPFDPTHEPPYVDVDDELMHPHRCALRWPRMARGRETARRGGERRF